LRQQKQCEQTASMAELKTVTLAATIINSLFAVEVNLDPFLVQLLAIASMLVIVACKITFEPSKF